ncbi:MAG: restriction endonuclease [Bacteroidetes bacterium]|nr:restriction endonuclease [Bacteroidota bacterium]
MKTKLPVRITKSTGEESYFSEKKLEASLRRAGADEEQVNAILVKIRSSLYDGISTKEIYRLAFAELRAESKFLAARYNLKQAIIALGPEGFYFEKYIAAVLAARGYETKHSVILNGKCVKHEVDVLAKKGNELHIIECKFHRHDGLNCDVKVPLYIHSRFNDIRNYFEEHPVKDVEKYYGWVVTNTRFTEDAVNYGNCTGLKLLSWNFPAGKGLRELADSEKLYPLTCLTSLTKTEKNLLLEKELILAKDIPSNLKLIKMIGMTLSRQNALLEEIRNLCGK